MTIGEHIEELQSQLTEAVLQQDLLAAMEALQLLACYSDRWARVLQRARRITNPPAPLPDVAAFPLPIPGQRVGATIGQPWPL